MTSALAQFDQAQLLQWQWKTDAMLHLAVAVVHLALRLDEFAADDLDAAINHGGAGICGSIFARLEQNQIIQRVGIWRGDQFFGKERASQRPGRKAAKLKVYTLHDRPKALAFLRANHQASDPWQPELIQDGVSSYEFRVPSPSTRNSKPETRNHS